MDSAAMTRKRYVLLGFGLMALKYSVDAGLYYLVTGAWWRPSDYLSPLYSQRMAGAPAAGEVPPWFLVVLLVWGLLFAVTGSLLSSRRATNAGYAPWWGVFFFLPFLNYALILVLSLVPSAGPGRTREPELAVGSCRSRTRSSFWSAVPAGLVLLLMGALLFVTMVRRETDYGLAVFLSLPLTYGVALGYLINRPVRESARYTLSYASQAGMVACLGLLVFALEGLICIVMAYPVVYVALVAGALLGRQFAQRPEQSRSAPLAILFALPLASWIDGELPGTEAREVRSSVVIDALPQDVWEHVVSFSELPKPGTWLFRTGVAYPLRARIEGRGVGAVRHCEFSTGAFVEPITVWDEPHRLSFDVVEQPQPMEEWSFYEEVHPPHLAGTFRSVRGEFRLVALPGGRTRLEGSTWYELRMAPEVYWRLWADLIVHRIHGRVLRHVKRLAEAK